MPKKGREPYLSPASFRIWCTVPVGMSRPPWFCTIICLNPFFVKIM